MNKTAQQLRIERDQIDHQLEQIEKPTRISVLKSQIGKCFKYRNNWGDNRYWWLYTRITGHDDYYNSAFKFQRKLSCTASSDANTFEVETNGSFIESAGCMAITQSEFDDAWVAFLTEMQKEFPNKS